MAHPADLPVQSLCKNNTETFGSCLYDSAGPGNCIQYGHSLCHLPDKIICYFSVYCYNIFLLMIVPTSHDPVHQVALICEKQQSLRIFIQSADGIDPHRIIQIFCNCFFIELLFCAAHNAYWFIKKQKHLPAFFLQWHTIQAYYCICLNPFSCPDDSAIYSNPATVCIFICVSPGTHTGTAQIFINSNCVWTCCPCIFIHCFIIYFFPVLRNRQFQGRLVFFCCLLYDVTVLYQQFILFTKEENLCPANTKGAILFCF